MPDVKEELDTLLQKEMDRKDFLKLVGIGFVSLTGVASVIKTLNTLSPGAPDRGKRIVGYGSSAYGGSKTRAS